MTDEQPRESESLVISDSRRRVALIAGAVLAVLVVLVLIWFAFTHTESADPAERGLGHAPTPAEPMRIG